MIFPWQTQQWEQLVRAKREQRLPHAILLAGMAGVGKAAFANHFTQSLLCQQPDADSHACQQCHSCQLIAGRAHPNVLWIEPEEDSRTIKIDQVRAVSEFVNQSSFQGDSRVVILNPANAMNINAANALLKTLEEPSSGAVLILISHQHDSLPATILSRCQKIAFARPGTSEALQWLAEQGESVPNPTLLLRLANGAPLAALQLLKEDTLSSRQTLLQSLYALQQQQADPLKVAAQLKDSEPVVMLDDMLSWTLDVMKLQLGAGAAEMANVDFEPQLVKLSQQTQLSDNVKRLNYLQGLRGQVAFGMNLNKQLVMESALLQFLS